MSPLIRLIGDQINNLRSLGLSAVNLSDPEVDGLRVGKGEYSIVYGSPEAWHTNERWRAMHSKQRSATSYTRRLSLPFQ